MKLRAPHLWTASFILSLVPLSGASADAVKTPEETLIPPAADIKVPEGPAASAGGRITVDKPTVDAGEVVRGKLATAVFEIKNTGTGTLKIISAKPG